MANTLAYYNKTTSKKIYRTCPWTLKMLNIETLEKENVIKTLFTVAIDNLV